MSLESSFTLLREIGILLLNDREEIRFSIDAYRGFRYISVRKYTSEAGFSAPTKYGVTLTPDIAHALTAHLLALPEQHTQLKLGPIGKFAKRPGICIIATLLEMGTERGLELRQWEQGKGYPHKGIFMPLAKWAEIRQLFADTCAALDEQPDLDF